MNLFHVRRAIRKAVNIDESDPVDLVALAACVAGVKVGLVSSTPAARDLAALIPYGHVVVVSRNKARNSVKRSTAASRVLKRLPYFWDAEIDEGDRAERAHHQAYTRRCVMDFLGEAGVVSDYELRCNELHQMITAAADALLQAAGVRLRPADLVALCASLAIVDSREGIKDSDIALCFEIVIAAAPLKPQRDELRDRILGSQVTRGSVPSVA